jgi:hypothetical protein
VAQFIKSHTTHRSTNFFFIVGFGVEVILLLNLCVLVGDLTAVFQCYRDGGLSCMVADLIIDLLIFFRRPAAVAESLF